VNANRALWTAAEYLVTINAGVPIWLFCLVCAAGSHLAMVHDENRGWQTAGS